MLYEISMLIFMIKEYIYRLYAKGKKRESKYFTTKKNLSKQENNNRGNVDQEAKRHIQSK